MYNHCNNKIVHFNCICLLNSLLSSHIDVSVFFKYGLYTFSEDDGDAVVDVILEGETEVDVVVFVTGGIF